MSFWKSVCKTVSSIATAPFKAMASIATGQNCFAKGPTIINNGCCGPRPYCGAHGPSVFGRCHCHRPHHPHHPHHMHRPHHWFC